MDMDNLFSEEKERQLEKKRKFIHSTEMSELGMTWEWLRKLRSLGGNELTDVTSHVEKIYNMTVESICNHVDGNLDQY